MSIAKRKRRKVSRKYSKVWDRHRLGLPRPKRKNPREGSPYSLFVKKAMAAREKLKSKRGGLGVAISTHLSTTTAQNGIEKLVNLGFKRDSMAVVPASNSFNKYWIVIYPD